MVSGLFGGPLSTREACEDREARAKLLLAQREEEQRARAAQRKGTAPSSSGNQGGSSGAAEGSRSHAHGKAKPRPAIPPLITGAELQRKRIRSDLSSDLDAFDDLNRDSPRKAGPSEGKDSPRLRVSPRKTAINGIGKDSMRALDISSREKAVGDRKTKKQRLEDEGGAQASLKASPRCCSHLCEGLTVPLSRTTGPAC